MPIERHQAGPRMSQAVVHGNTVYLAGQVADDTSQSTAGQTKQVLAEDRRAAQGRRNRQVEAAFGQYLADRHRQFRRDELGVGRLGVAGQHAGAGDGRGEARHAGLSGRDHGGRGKGLMGVHQRPGSLPGGDGIGLAARTVEPS